MQIGFAIEGAEQIAAALDALARPIARRIAIEALIEGGEPMRRLVADLAPRRPGVPDLADNIVIGPVRSREYQDPREFTVGIGPTKFLGVNVFFYDFFNEYGTVHQQAHPFYRPAFDAMAPQSLTIIGDAMWRELAARGVSRSVSVPTTVSAPDDGDVV